MSSDTQPALVFESVVKRFGRRLALDAFNMRVPRGITCGLVGSNGAGKTTSIAIATGLLSCNSGSVNILGDGPFDPAKHSGRVSMMPQDSELPLYARVRDILTFYAQLQGIDRKNIKHDVERVIEWVHLADRADDPVRTLSHGMRRRIVVAQAFLGTPELVILDEPLSGLDPREVVNIRKLLQRRPEQQTVIISSHNLHELELVCDHIAFIEKGKLVRQDSMDEITGRRQVIHYTLSPGQALSTTPLSALLPDATIAIEENGTVLSCEYSGSEHCDADINRVVLNHLLANEIEILEVRCGKNLESVYMSHSSKAETVPPAH
jgi:ABC-2 type transport system ATP-binding protein